jgi:hypothetical protein
MQVFTPGSPGVGSAINSDGFFVLPGTYGLNGANAWVYDGQLYAGGPGYADAGLIIGMDGSLRLGQLHDVSVVSTGSPLAINLWFDTGGDGNFFSFLPSGLMTALNGDRYAGCGALSLTGASTCAMFAGAGAGANRTLAELQAGVVPGIDGNTRAALWIGVTHDGGNAAQSADISEITISSVPEPGSFVLTGTVICLLGIAGRRQFLRR